MPEIFIQQLNSKQPKAFKTLYADYFREMVLYALHFVDEHAIAEDIVQELFVKLWKLNIHFPDDNRLKRYLFTMVRNSALDYLKHAAVEAKYVAHITALSQDEVFLSNIEMEEDVYQLLFNEIAKLPKREKEAFELYLEGKKNDEIAEIMKISVLTVKKLKNRSTNRLKATMGKLFELSILIFTHTL